MGGPERTNKWSVPYADLKNYKNRSYSSLCTAQTLKGNTSPCQHKRLGPNAHVWTKTECSTKYKVWHVNGNGEGHTTCEHVSALHGFHFHDYNGWHTDPTGKPYYTQSKDYDLEPANWLERSGYQTGMPKGSFWTTTPCGTRSESETVTEAQPVQNFYEVYYNRSNSTKCEPETALHQIAFCSVGSRNQKRYMSQRSVPYADLKKYKSDMCTAEALRN